MTKQAKRQYKAVIAGKKYVISGHASIPHFKATEELINKQFAQIALVAPKLAPLDQATLVTFNAISDQLYKQAEIDDLQQQVARLQAELDKKRNEIPTQPKAKTSAVSSIIDTAKQESRSRTSNQIFKRTEQ
ncbi:cell division protein ZapA [Leuconostoc falkenbergense]|uniref:Cell division protein ZapA n=1 Tax=Leuconostoc falkenbergense TaxID=2766470 RepID=A0A9X3IQZ2_9LACO|nr:MULTISPECIES: cell division protein ZapA [Leuconostoc]HCU42867.1 cell division protein ZapA [Leuconostoc pseudomesenteroides]MCT4378421.1 cell division protein ZapA [Leuconostoc falkenbergense]MCT4390441.1 cell division protein ZapA [Leuconostoc falkenbergense]MCX7579626.1 cell division protein ZapA [Leuconostoc falkenbergense]MDM7645733.1 cell division protein ZapA [Leuconostoc falkenbergense]